MKGVLKPLLAVFLLLFILTSVSCGGCYIVYSSFKDQLTKNDPNRDEQIAKQLLNISAQNDFILQKGVDFWLLKALVYVYKANSQPLFLIEPSNLIFPYNEDNFKNFLNKDKINQNLSQSASSEVVIKEITILEDSKLKTKGRSIPYVRAQIVIFDQSDNETQYLDTIIAAMSSQDRKTTVFIVSGYNPQKFNPIVVKKFISNIQPI